MVVGVAVASFGSYIHSQSAAYALASTKTKLETKNELYSNITHANKHRTLATYALVPNKMGGI